MPPPRSPLHVPLKPSQRIAARKVQRSTIDQWFDRAGQASQVLLLLLGVFGYFYTVLPLYQKALLDEEIAKKTLDLNKASADLAKATLDLQSKEKELQRLAMMTEQKTRELARKEDELTRASSGMRQAQHVAALAKIDAQANYISYRREFLVGADQRIRGCWARRLLAGPASDDWQRCIATMNNFVKASEGQLQHGDAARLDRAVRTAFGSREGDFSALMTDVDSRREAIRKENAAINAENKAARALPYSSRDHKADTERSARSSELFKETFDVESKAGERMYKLLNEVAAQVSKSMWPFQAEPR